MHPFSRARRALLLDHSMVTRGACRASQTRTPGLIVVKAKWQWGLSVVSHISSASPKIWLDSVCYPSLSINLISHTQDLYCMSHPGYKLQAAVRCPRAATMTAILWTGKNNCSFCFIAHLILCWHTYPPPLQLLTLVYTFYPVFKDPIFPLWD